MNFERSTGLIQTAVNGRIAGHEAPVKQTKEIHKKNELISKCEQMCDNQMNSNKFRHDKHRQQGNEKQKHLIKMSSNS